MSTLTKKMLAYVEARANGLTGHAAVLVAGYSASGADVTAAKLNRDPRIQKAIAAAKRKASRAADKAEADEEEETTKKPKMKAKYTSSLDVLRDCYNNPKLGDGVRIDCAKAALPYEHARLADSGKKEKAKERAKEIARGGSEKAGKPKFATKAPPPLRAIAGGKA